MWADLQSIRMTYDAIVQGERPWTALGDFLNYWNAYARDQREALIHDPLQEPTRARPEHRQWAAFCAATVEYLCTRYAIPCPAWVHNPAFCLPEPWYQGLGAQRPHVQERLRQEAPEPFVKRNIFCSPHAFDNKYELAEKSQQLVAPRQTA